MALGDVYTSLQNGTLDGVENPLSTLYGQSFQEVTKNILMTGHLKLHDLVCRNRLPQHLNTGAAGPVIQDM